MVSMVATVSFAACSSALPSSSGQRPCWRTAASVAAARTASATRDDSSAAWSASDVKLRHAGSKRTNGAGGSRRSSRQREIGWSK